MKIKILISLLILLSLNLYSSDIDFKCDEKINLINQIIENPENFAKIIRNSEFYSDSIFGENSYGLKSYYVENIFRFISLIKYQCILHYTREHTNDYFTFRYIGNEDTTFLIRDIVFAFSHFDNKWNLLDFKFNSDYYILSSRENLNSFNSLSSNKKLTKIKMKEYYLNKNYLFCEKISFINELLSNTENYWNIFLNSQFNNSEITISQDFLRSKNILDLYLKKYYKFKIWLNYPFALDDINVDKYVYSNSLNDYFIISCWDANQKKTKYLTLEFEISHSKWFLKKVMKGTQIYIALEPYQYLIPFSE